MKIKNISNKDLSFSVLRGNTGLMFNVKPNQVMYCESNGLLNKQILIFERKKLIYVNKEMEKPNYVDYYKCFFEAGDYVTNKFPTTIDLDDDSEEDDNVPTFEFEGVAEITTEEFDEEGEQPVKRGRGRPKKPVAEKPAEEKKGRGRPKGSTKKS